MIEIWALDTVMPLALVPLESWAVAVDVAVIGVDLAAQTKLLLVHEHQLNNSFC